LEAQLDALLVQKRNRFDKALLQLAGAYNFARHFGIRKIYYIGYSFLNEAALLADIEFVKCHAWIENNLIGDQYCP
jgi:hypothetical protein